MRVLLSYAALIPPNGGIQRQVIALASELRSRGHSVELVFNARLWESKTSGGSGTRQIEPRPIPISLPTIHGSPLPSLAGLKALRSLVLEANIVHVHGYHSLESITIALVSRLVCRPVILTGHDLDLPSSYGLGHRILKAIFDVSIGKVLLRSARVVVALTSDQLEDYVRLGVAAGKITTVPCMVPQLNIGAESRRTPPLRNRLQNQTVVISVGRLVSHKGFTSLIDTWRDVIREHPKALLVIAGASSQYTPQILLAKELSPVKDQIHIIEDPPDSVLALVYEAAEVFVSASSFEGFGVALLEAMNYGIPCIALDIKNVRTVVRPGVTGILLESTADLGSAISRLLSDPETRSAMRANARLAAKEYAAPAVVSKLEAAYQRAEG